METARTATNLKVLSDLAGCLPAISQTTSIKAYYDSSALLLSKVRANSACSGRLKPLNSKFYFLKNNGRLNLDSVGLVSPLLLTQDPFCDSRHRLA